MSSSMQKFIKPVLTACLIITFLVVSGFFDIALAATNPYADALKGITTLAFTAFFTLFAAITLLALAVMLFIRYIYLTLLLIFSPIIWLLWIFPSTQKYWSDWWHNFMKWVFFAPVMLFFLYLAVATLGQYPASLAKYAPAGDLSNQPFAISVAYIGNLVAILGLLLGGLFAANALGIAGAKTFYGWAQGAGKGVGGWAGKKAGRFTVEKTAGKVLGSERVKGWTEKLAGSRVPGVRFIGQGINRLGSQVEGFTKKPYEDLAKNLAKNRQRLNSEILASRGAKRAILLNQAAKTKDISDKVIQELLSDAKAMGQVANEFKISGLNFKDIEKAVSRTVKMLAAETSDALRAATDEFVQSLTPKDYKKGQWNDIFKSTTDVKVQRIQKRLAGTFAEFAPEAYAKIVPDIKSNNLTNFTDIMKAEIDLLKSAPDSVRREKGERAEEALKKTLGRRITFGEETWTPPTTETT